MKEIWREHNGIINGTWRKYTGNIKGNHGNSMECKGNMKENKGKWREVQDIKGQGRSLRKSLRQSLRRSYGKPFPWQTGRLSSLEQGSANKVRGGVDKQASKFSERRLCSKQASKFSKATLPPAYLQPRPFGKMEKTPWELTAIKRNTKET